MTIIPYVIERSKNGERTYDIYSRLLEDRIIFVGEEVHAHMVNSIVAQMLFLEKQDPDKEITLYVNSPGGEVYSGMALFDTMQIVKCPIRTICVGLAASMGSVFLVWGTKWRRCALKHSRIMIHQPSHGAQGKISDTRIAVEEWIRIRDMINTIFVERTGQSLEVIERDMDRDKWMSAQEALEYGIIDEVIG